MPRSLGGFLGISLALALLFNKRAMALQAYRNLAFIAYGALNFTKGAYLKHAQSFDPAALEVDLKGKHCIVTGANSGMGKATAEALAARGATVHLLCRNKERGAAAVSDITQKTGNADVHLALCDISSVQQIQTFADGFVKSGAPLHVLVNNAGSMEHERKLTPDGFETNFATNVLAAFVLTEALMPVLEKARQARVITVSSGGMYTEDLETEDLQAEKVKKFDGTPVYAKNKRQQVALTEKWAEVHKDKGVAFFTMHPGWVDTPILQTQMPSFYNTFQGKLRLPEEGADTIVWLAAQEKEKLISGAFYFDRTVASKHLSGFRTSYKPEATDKLYTKLLELARASGQQ